MVIFHSYVSLPEGNPKLQVIQLRSRFKGGQLTQFFVVSQVIPLKSCAAPAPGGAGSWLRVVDLRNSFTIVLKQG